MLTTIKYSNNKKYTKRMEASSNRKEHSTNWNPCESFGRSRKRQEKNNNMGMEEDIKKQKMLWNVMNTVFETLISFLSKVFFF